MVFLQSDRVLIAVSGRSRGITAMADPSGRASQSCLLVYDGQCRLCVTAKKGLERLGAYADATPIRMVPYQSEEAKQALGEGYWSGRPNVAFLVRPTGEIIRGLDAFLALLPGLKGGRVLSVLLRFPLVKPIGYLLYWFVARYRYSVFGKVELVGVSENPSKPSRELPHR
jgi:predicted DCC family thiol-disulfide oxidoreductase YuxK